MKIAIILCGGTGSRLWPLSTQTIPKQFIKLVNNKTLIGNTLERIPSEYKKIFVTNIKFENELSKYVSHDDEIIYEKYSKNTGYAILFTLLYINKKYGNANILVVPCDHIFDNDTFHNILSNAMNIVSGDNIITFGIKPTYPETGYGYIKIKNDNYIDYFIEKPVEEKAITLIKDGCLWNSGVFIFNSSRIYNFYKEKYPTEFEICQKTFDNSQFIDNAVYIGDSYQNIVSESFDIMVMEKISGGIVLKYTGNWSDIGDWKTVYDILCNTENNINGENINLIDSTDNLVYSDCNKTIICGVDNHIIINSNNNLLILSKDKVNEFKAFIKKN